MIKRKPFKTHKSGKGKSASSGPRNQPAAREGERDRKFRTSEGRAAPNRGKPERPKPDRPREDRPGSGATQRLTGQGSSGRDQGGSGYWLFGHHAVAAAMANPERRIYRLVQIGSAGDDLPQPKTDHLLPHPLLPRWETIDREAPDHILGRDAVHQGIAARVAPLPEHHIDEIGDLARDSNGNEKTTAVVLILDQVTDPHNVGAILRSAAAFGAIAVEIGRAHV